MMNWHVRKYYRWKHFLAVRQGRQLAQWFWAATYNKEFGNVNIIDWDALKSPK